MKLLPVYTNSYSLPVPRLGNSTHAWSFINYLPYNYYRLVGNKLTRGNRVTENSLLDTTLFSRVPNPKDLNQ